MRLVAVTQTPEFPVDTATAARVLGSSTELFTVAMPFHAVTPAQEDRYAEALGRADGILLRTGVITERMLKGMEKTRIIAVHGAGVDQVDVAAAARAGIVVTNAPAGNANAVAEMTLALMLSLVRGIHLAARVVCEQEGWDEGRVLGIELRGRTVGIVGFGQIGRRVARLCQAVGMHILVADPLVPASRIHQAGAKPVSLRRLLPRAHFVTVHVPLGPGTRGLIGPAELRLMRSDAYLINTSRGPVVQEGALVEALTRGRIAGAGLDVLETEPPPPDHPLRRLPNVLITPHMAGSTRESLARIAAIGAADIARVLARQRPRHPVGALEANGRVLKERRRPMLGHPGGRRLT